MKATILGIIFTFITCVIGITNYLDTHYTTYGMITDIKGEVITIETIDGNLWECRATGFTEKKNVEVTFYNNNTEYNIYDDQITGIR